MKALPRNGDGSGPTPSLCRGESPTSGMWPHLVVVAPSASHHPPCVPPRNGDFRKLADVARKPAIPVWRFNARGATYAAANSGPSGFDSMAFLVAFIPDVSYSLSATIKRRFSGLEPFGTCHPLVHERKRRFHRGAERRAKTVCSGPSLGTTSLFSYRRETSRRRAWHFRAPGVHVGSPASQFKRRAIACASEDIQRRPRQVALSSRDGANGSQCHRRFAAFSAQHAGAGPDFRGPAELRRAELDPAIGQHRSTAHTPSGHAFVPSFQIQRR